MATIVTRASKGSALTWTEGDNNITNLNTDKIELTDLSVSTGSASGGGTLSYNNTTGAFSFSPADVSTYITSGGALGTPSSGTLTNCTVNGTDPIGYRDLPAVGTKTSSYSLTTSDIGKYVQVGTGGSITIPNATFSEGDVVVIANNTSGAITITCSITTAYIAGTDSDKATVSLATRGVANILFLSGTACIITGNVS